MPQSYREHHNQDKQHPKQGKEASDDEQLQGELHLLVPLPPGSFLLLQLLLHLRKFNAGAGVSLPGPSRQALGCGGTATGAGALCPGSTLRQTFILMLPPRFGLFSGVNQNLLEAASLCSNIQALALAQLTLEPATFSAVALIFIKSTFEVS